jgi:hypothetical protein
MSATNEKAALADGQLNESAKVAATQETVNTEADRFMMQWLRTGVDYYRRLAHVAADAARKGVA